ncbi:MAG: UDP binding domain-containing protein, partial [Burkholderiales bacterium]
GVDPYYLTHKAQTLGYHPEVILSGRRINDGMGKFIAEKTVKLMIAAGSPIKGARVNVLGLTFKEDCPDLRNSRVIDIIKELKSYGIDVAVHDPAAEPAEARHEYGVDLTPWDKMPVADSVVVAVAHREYRKLAPSALAAQLKAGGGVVDVKSVLDPAQVRSAGFAFWRL